MNLFLQIDTARLELVVVDQRSDGARCRRRQPQGASRAEAELAAHRRQRRPCPGGEMQLAGNSALHPALMNFAEADRREQSRFEGAEHGDVQREDNSGLP